MKITLQFLRSRMACGSGYEWFKEEKLNNKSLSVVIRRCIKTQHKSYASWLLRRVLIDPYRSQFDRRSSWSIPATESQIKYGLKLAVKQGLK